MAARKPKEEPAVVEADADQAEAIESTTVRSGDVEGRADLGTGPGTDEAPRTEGLPDKESTSVGSGYRFAEKIGATVQTHEDDEGRTLTWTDPDAVPGTVGDDPVETVKALAAAGSPAVKVEDAK